MSNIQNIIAREILDSRGNPTIEVDVTLADGSIGRGVVPSGASTGSKEALELRDGDIARYNGKGILKAINSVNIIAKELVGLDGSDRHKIDQIMIDLDATINKEKYGANAILGISFALARALAISNQCPLFYYLAENKKFKMPKPMINIINGGAHANNMIDIQEFMITPIGDVSFKEGIRKSAEIFYKLKDNLIKLGLSTNVGDEGGFAANINGAEKAIEIILESTINAGYTPGKDIEIALDVAASELYKNGIYNFVRSNKKFEVDQLIEYYAKLVKNYPIFSIEDPLDENDFEGWIKITAALGDKVNIVGDDIFVTNPMIFKDLINKNIGNSILIKPNQIGTLKETEQAIKIAKENNYKTIMSHRSGETEDVIISHLAVGYGVDLIKSGSLSRSDRVAKYNELIRIEEFILKNNF
jgi:enolase